VPPGVRGAMVDARPITPTSQSSSGTLIRSRSTVTAQYKSFDAKRAMLEKVREKDFTEISSLAVCEQMMAGSC
jgi:hypothetical protein